MSRKLLIETAEGSREVDYGSLPSEEVTRRIRAYEQRYGLSFAQHSSRVSCETIGPHEMTDLMDWECLETERAARARAAYLKR